MNDLFYYYGIVFIVTVIYSVFKEKEENINISSSNVLEVSGNEFKNQKRLGCFMFFISMVWIIMGLFSDEKLLFILLLIMIFVLPALHAVKGLVVDGKKVDINIQVSKKALIINGIFKIVITVSILYNHFKTQIH